MPRAFTTLVLQSLLLVACSACCCLPLLILVAMIRAPAFQGELAMLLLCAASALHLCVPLGFGALRKKHMPGAVGLQMLATVVWLAFTAATCVVGVAVKSEEQRALDSM